MTACLTCSDTTVKPHALISIVRNTIPISRVPSHSPRNHDYMRQVRRHEHPQALRNWLRRGCHSVNGKNDSCLQICTAWAIFRCEFLHGESDSTKRQPCRIPRIRSISRIRIVSLIQRHATSCTHTHSLRQQDGVLQGVTKCEATDNATDPKATSHRENWPDNEASSAA